MSELKILLVSCSPYVPSGYGVGAKSYCDILTEMGNEVAIYNIFGSLGFTDY